MSEKIIKDQEETKEETKIGSEEIVKNGETKTGSEEIVKNEEKEDIRRNIHVHDICKLHSCFRYALSGKEFSDERADFAYCHVNNGEWQQQDEDSSRNNFSEYF